MSDAELKKLEELRKMKNMKKETPKPEEIKKEEEDLPKIKADILPPVQFQRRG